MCFTRSLFDCLELVVELEFFCGPHTMECTRGTGTSDLNRLLVWHRYGSVPQEREGPRVRFFNLRVLDLKFPLGESY